MKRILIVGPKTAIVDRLAMGLGRWEVGVGRAPNGVTALTMMEHQRPELVILWSTVTDLAAHEFALVVKNDTSLDGALIYLVDAPENAGMLVDVKAAFDRVVPEDRLEVLINHACDALALKPRAAAQPEEWIRGAVHILGFADLVQVLSHTEKSGRLDISGTTVEGTIYFDDGLVRHAEWGGFQGVEAFEGLYELTALNMDARFEFALLSVDAIAQVPRTILSSAQEILLTIMVAIDEGRSAPRVVQPGGPA